MSSFDAYAAAAEEQERRRKAESADSAVRLAQQLADGEREFQRLIDTALETLIKNDAPRAVNVGWKGTISSTFFRLRASSPTVLFALADGWAVTGEGELVHVVPHSASRLSIATLRDHDVAKHTKAFEKFAAKYPGHEFYAVTSGPEKVSSGEWAAGFGITGRGTLGYRDTSEDMWGSAEATIGTWVGKALARR